VYTLWVTRTDQLMYAVRLSTLVIAGLTAGVIGAQRAESPLPAPAGPYPLGRRQLNWIDDSRVDPQDQSRRREIAAWVWYPAKPIAGATPAERTPGKWVDARNPSVKSIRSHAFADAPIDAARRYPVLIFAHGLGETPLDYSTLLEDVASQGYIVAGVVSPEFARVIVLADGRAVPGLVMAKPQPEESGFASASDASKTAAAKALQDSSFIVSKDLSFGLNQLATVRGLQDGIDMTRVGVVGHSIGGSAAFQFSHDDARVRAIFDLDGTGRWSPQNSALKKPALVLSADSTRGISYDTALKGATPGFHLRLAGTQHAFPMDRHVLSLASKPGPPRGAPAKGTSPARALQVTAKFILGFFNEFLNGQRETLLDGPSADYPEITFERGRPR
jgi:predicted dienelactone hydrolase